MTTNLRKSIWLAAMVMTAALMAASAQAETIAIDFSGLLGGTLSWAGGTSPLVGQDIMIGMVEGQFTPENADSFAVTAGLLNFTTGALTAFSPTEMTFGGGGSVSLTGGVPDAGIDDGSTLASGGTWSPGSKLNITDTETVCDDPDDPNTCTSSSSGFFGGGGTGNIMLSELLDFFGMSAWVGLPFKFVDTELFLDLVWNNPMDFSQGFTASIRSSDFNNQAPPIPEPASIIMLGTGMIGMARILSRSRRRDTT